MHPITTDALSAATVSYEEPPLAELELDGVDYRLDPGRGSTVAVSTRPTGTWDWTPMLEGRWDGSRLRAKGLDHRVVTALAAALGAALRERAERSEA